MRKPIYDVWNLALKFASTDLLIPSVVFGNEIIKFNAEVSLHDL